MILRPAPLTGALSLVASAVSVVSGDAQTGETFTATARASGLVRLTSVKGSK